ncbi:MAG: Ig domain-containing protein [Nitrospiria bacterium]
MVILGADVGSIEFTSAAPKVIGIKQAGQTETSVIKFAVKDVNGQPVGDGINVDFTINGPKGGEVLIPTSASTTGGFVQTTLQSGFVAGPVRVVATTSVNTTSISTSSTGVSIGGGIPSATHFDLAASRLRLAGFSHTNLQSTITAFLADRFGNFNVLPATSVSFFTEAGAIDRNKDTDNIGIAPVTFRTQDPDPADVPAAAAGTPFFPSAESSYACGINTCNPRDGWSTILATTIGEEAFIDASGNGLFDAGENFTDLGEPFLDQNDNGAFDAGEIFVDFNKDGVFTGPDGQWNAETMIWTGIRLTLTGTGSFGPNTSRFDDTNDTNGTQVTTFQIPNGGFQNFRVFVSDFNQNRLPAGTTISVTKEGGGKLAGGKTITLADGLSTGASVIGITLSDSDGTTKKQELVSLVVDITTNVETVGTISSQMILNGFLDFGPTISTTTLPAGTIGQSYNVIIDATGGVKPYTWSANGIPAGLSIGTASGEISGTISAAAGTYNFTITVTDSSTPTISDTKSFSLTVN